MDEFIRFKCWDDSRISKVFSKVALTVDRATFLATHVPIREIALDYQSNESNELVAETDLLAELQTCALNDLHTLMIIKGIQGTGKSHLIRWLKEEYMSANSADIALLIAREDSSLRNTLQQIIDSELFPADSMPDALRRLTEATAELSKAELAQNLLAQLIIGHQQVLDNKLTIQEEHKPHRARVFQNIKHFLLEEAIREHLISEEGVLGRLARFLSEGSGTREAANVPGFDAKDFQFETDLLRQIKHYSEAESLANDLAYEEKHRTSLARYFNELLSQYAISHATRLLSSDLKQMFADVRRSLLAQGKNLVLFIEDITAFMGIDQGIIDVLVTEHYREGEQEYCRLISVIGVTDAYFQDHFPGNIKDRITHLLTLAHSDEENSGLLDDPTTRAEFAGRYLNAIRVTGKDLDTWAQAGAQNAHLPNRCARCQFQEECHTAFGYIELQPDEPGSQRVGLYPFNHQALTTMYESIDTQRYKKTPRIFINGIVAHVMQNHAGQIAEGKFPPPPQRLGTVFNVPRLQSQLDSSTLSSQYPAKAAYLETLFRVWGNREVVRTVNSEGSSFIGAIPEVVFSAFDLPLVETTIEAQGAPTPAPTSPPTPPPSQPPSHQQASYAHFLDAIEAWRQGGSLERYEKITNWLISFIASAIDWESHDIHPTLLNELLQQRFFVIKDQAGRKSSSFYLEFERSEDLALVIYALTIMNHEPFESIPADQLSGYFATLSTWLENEEQRIVEFIRHPKNPTLPPRTLENMLITDGLFLLGLESMLGQANSVGEIYQALIGSSQAGVEVWQKAIGLSEGTHTSNWPRLMAQLNRHGEVGTIKDELIKGLSCSGEDAGFIDASMVFDVIDELNQVGWELPAMDLEYPIGFGQKVNSTYTILQRDMVSLVDEETRAVLDASKSLYQLIGDTSLDTLYQRTRELLGKLRATRNLYDGQQLDPIFQGNSSNVLLATQEYADLHELISALEEAQVLGEKFNLLAGPLSSYAPQIRNTVQAFKSLEQALLRIHKELQQKGNVSQDLREISEAIEKSYKEVDALIKVIGSEATN